MRPERLTPALRRIDRRLPNSLRQGVRSAVRPGRARGPLVSVVVTVDATAAAHVDEGLHSVRGQTHRNLEVVVVAVGDPGAADETVRRHAADDVRLRLRGSAPDQAAARNHGAAKAHGDYLLFVDASDLLPPTAVAALVTPLETSGSALSIGRRREVRGLVRSVVQPPDPLHDEPRTGQTLDSCPVAVIDLGAENRMFRRSYWASARLAFTSTTSPSSRCTPPRPRWASTSSRRSPTSR